MSWTREQIAKGIDESEEFRAAYEEEQAILSLVRARSEANLSQKDVADALGVSQPYVAQVERGTKPMSLSLMLRYANVVGVNVAITAREKRSEYN